jgi:hypothetical protein
MARESKPAINCKWAAENKFLVQPDGQVVPCCYLANAMYPLDESYDKVKDKGHWLNTEVMQKYHEHKDELNAFKCGGALKALEHPFFKEWLPKTWDEDPIWPCNHFCNEETDKL